MALRLWKYPLCGFRIELEFHLSWVFLVCGVFVSLFSFSQELFQRKSTFRGIHHPPYCFHWNILWLYIPWAHTLPYPCHTTPRRVDAYKKETEFRTTLTMKYNRALAFIRHFKLKISTIAFSSKSPITLDLDDTGKAEKSCDVRASVWKPCGSEWKYRFLFHKVDGGEFAKAVKRSAYKK